MISVSLEIVVCLFFSPIHIFKYTIISICNKSKNGDTIMREKLISGAATQTTLAN